MISLILLYILSLVQDLAQPDLNAACLKNVAHIGQSQALLESHDHALGQSRGSQRPRASTTTLMAVGPLAAVAGMADSAAAGGRSVAVARPQSRVPLHLIMKYYVLVKQLCSNAM